MRRRVRRFLRCTKSNIIKFATPFCIFYLRSFCPTKQQKKKKENRKGKLEKFRSGFVPLRSLGCCQGFPSYASLLQQLNYSTEICSSLQKSRALDGRKKSKESERAQKKKKTWNGGLEKLSLFSALLLFLLLMLPPLLLLPCFGVFYTMRRFYFPNEMSFKCIRRRQSTCALF